MINIIYIFKINPSILFKTNYNPFLFKKLIIPLNILIPINTITLSLLINYNLLKFINIYIKPIIKPIFKTPKKSTINTITSFINNYSLKLLITNHIYKQKIYNKQKTTIITTNFSTISTTFIIIITKTLKLIPH